MTKTKVEKNNSFISVKIGGYTIEKYHDDRNRVYVVDHRGDYVSLPLDVLKEMISALENEISKKEDIK